MSGGWVTMPLNGWTMLAQEEVRAMTTTTGTDLAPRLRAFKHRLDPNPAQATLLAQYAGAARVAYNMLTAHNRAALAASAARRTELAESGLAGPELRPIQQGVRVAGSAVTVLGHPGDNLMIHAAVEQTEPGDLLVVTATSPSMTSGVGLTTT